MAKDTAHRLYDYKDLTEARKNKDSRVPKPHQIAPVNRLSRWYENSKLPAGGLLVLPTGGGKTFTAAHFLVQKPLSDGYKVLWLAGKHFLLNQAFEELGKNTGQLSEKVTSLNVRKVSGNNTHDGIGDLKTSDDIVMSTDQTFYRAWNKGKPQAKLMDWLESSEGKLFVVYDEAHHAQAPTSHKPMTWLRERYSDFRLLGLTATPKHNSEGKRGWMKKMFPQGILYQTTVNELIQSGILSKPVEEQHETGEKVEVDDRELDMWENSVGGDVPKRIVKRLAENEPRNQLIANTYAENREKYGKTIMFASGFEQCEAIADMLEKHGVRADSIYSHVGGNAKTATERNKRGSLHNDKVLQMFKNDELDVLLNIQMLTEGIDVPSVNSIFLTRQTTSSILMQQMVGRGMRGPEIGGTEETNLVFFIDQWDALINWVEYGDLEDGIAEEKEVETRKRLPLQNISIELVRRLAEEIASGHGVTSEPFLNYLPMGWYRLEYATLASNQDETLTVHKTVMVMSNLQEGWEKLLEEMLVELPEEYQEPDLDLEEQSEYVSRLKERFFGDKVDIGNMLHRSIFDVLRHIGYNGEAPRFFPFEARNEHNLDEIATHVIQSDLGPKKIRNYAKNEYEHPERFWRTLYHAFDDFKSQLDMCVNRLQKAEETGQDPATYAPSFSNPVPIRKGEATEDDKKAVKERDNYTCLCCGFDNKRYLEVDHVLSNYDGGTVDMNNLQTLCRRCNNLKGTEYINFRNNKTLLSESSSKLPESIALPGTTVANKPELWERYLRKTINFFYRCAAVQEVKIGGRGKYFHNWQITLYPGNNPQWLADYLPETLELIRERRYNAKLTPTPETLTIVANGHGDVVIE